MNFFNNSCCEGENYTKKKHFVRRTKKGVVVQLFFINLETLTVDDRWAGFIIFLLGDPHGLEGGQVRQDGTTDPDGVLTFWWCNDLDLHGWWCQCGQFLSHTGVNTIEHGGTAGHNGVTV